MGYSKKSRKVVRTKARRTKPVKNKTRRNKRIKRQRGGE